jgi:chitodextrinase
MKLVTQLYIDTSGDPTGTPTYERVELFDFESIELTSTIQEVRDIGSVFTDFSQSFNVPASQNNNKVLKHYYQTNLSESFDARIKQRGLITINGITFKEGYIRLSEATLKNGKPSTYSLTFFGSLVTLKQALGDDELQDLIGLDDYNHEYDIDTVYDGFIDGLGLEGQNMVKSSNRDIIYPSISASNRWYYSTDIADLGEQDFQGDRKSVNIWTNGTTTLEYGINYEQLKPAIKVKNIISAIEKYYEDKGIVFSDDFFNNVEFNQLYLLLHNFKGTILNSSEAEKSLDYVVGTSESDSVFETASGYTELRPIEVSYGNTPWDGLNQVSYGLQLNVEVVSPSSGAEYTIELLEGETLIDSKDITGDGFMYTLLEYPNDGGLEELESKTYDNLRYRVKSRGNLVSFNITSLRIVRDSEYGVGTANPVYESVISEYDFTGGQQDMISQISITRFMPKIKTYDFLKGLFNMFNLTAYVDNGVIVVKTLDKFYNDSGDPIDISDQIDTKDIGIKRMDLYSDIKFEFSTPKTFGIINQNEVNQDDFGDLEYEGPRDSLIFDGTKYNIKLPFEKLFFDRLSDENTGNLTAFGNGWLVDKDQNETITAPVLFFNKNTSVDLEEKIGFKNKSFAITSYNRPSNSSNNELSTIHFGEEQDEYTGNRITNSLFQLHYSKYIANIFNQNSRIYTIKAFLNLNTIFSYEMNDNFVINNKEFFINSIRTDLSTGATDLELIPAYETEEVLPPDTEAPTVPTNLTFVSATDSKIQFSWTESTDNIAVTGYEVWVDGSFEISIGIGSLYTLGGLDPTTDYDIQLLAFDAQNNKSALCTAVEMTTTAVPDNIPPTTPTNLRQGIVTSSSIGLAWDASTDNVGVSLYKVYVDGVFNQDVNHPSTNANVTGLSSQTSYSFYVKAVDANLNESPISNIVNISTL